MGGGFGADMSDDEGVHLLPRCCCILLPTRALICACLFMHVCAAPVIAQTGSGNVGGQHGLTTNPEMKPLLQRAGPRRVESRMTICQT